MKKYLLTIIAVGLMQLNVVLAQGVGIGPGNPTPDNSAGLDIQFDNKGLLVPRLTTTQRDGIINPANGLVIYNVDCGAFNYFNGSSWVPLNSLEGLAPGTPGAITGDLDVCTNSTHAYSITPVGGAISYVWTIPSGASLTGQGATNISVTFGTASGSICVTANTVCGTSSASCIDINVVSPVSGPSAVAASDIAPYSFSANWNPVSSATTYQLDVSTASDFSSFVPGYNNLDVGNVISTSVTGLSCLTTYYYRVRVVYACGTSGNSNTIDVSTTVETGPAVFTYTGSLQTFTVPTCVTSITIKMWGGGGAHGSNSGSNGGGSGFVTAKMDVTPGDELGIVVAQGGQYQTGSSAYLGGGIALINGGRRGGPGGGRSAIVKDGVEIAIAGGGGGGGSNSGNRYGGAGGGPGEDAQDGTDNTGVIGGSNAGKGGKANGTGGSGGGNGTAGTSWNGTIGGTGGTAQGGNNDRAGGAGGGGYGGGGAGRGRTNSNGGGGGGSSYADAAFFYDIGGETGNLTVQGGATDPDNAGAGAGGTSNSGANGRVVIIY